MNRLSTGAFAVLVTATIAAFFVTQHLKVTTPLIQGFPRPVPGVIDPLHAVPCGKWNSGSTTISFYLQHRADTVDVYVLNQDGTIVDTVASGRNMRRNVRRPDGVFHWDGRESNGLLAPDGSYYFRVALLHQGRTIDLPDVPVRVKTVPPHPVITSVQPQRIPADGTRVKIRYTGNENRGGTVLVYRTDLPGGPRLVKSFLTPWNGHQAIWDGMIRQRPAPAGTYLIALKVTDAACDTGGFPVRIPPVPGTTHTGVTVSYLAATPPPDPVPAGSEAVVRVQSPGGAYRWSLERAGARKPVATGSSTVSTLRIRVPAGGPGLYELALRSATGSAEVPIVAGAPRHARVLVVLPALTWQGLNPVDDTGDGLPGTLIAGGPIALNRPLVDGLPAGFTDEAGLLAYLEASHRAYELTTDLALIAGTGPGLAGHAAVVLAGNERWLPASLLSALRSYVNGGGRILNLGGSTSLRRTVKVSDDRAFDPGAPAAVDALGGQAGAPSATSAGVGGPVIARLGAGTVIDLGGSGFGASLSHDAGARALVNQSWTILAG